MLAHLVIWRCAFDRCPPQPERSKPRRLENWFEVARTLADAATIRELALECRRARLLLAP